MKFNLITIVLTFIFLIFSTGFSDCFAQDSYKIKTLVIDAGHGGKDSGCHGASSYEKNITLNVALKLGNYIKNDFPELNIIYTRDTDVFVELHERSAIANRNDADLFISIHCNSAGKNNQAYGTETFIMGLNKTNANLDVAKRENAVIFQENNYKENYNGFDPNLPGSHIMFSLFQNVYREQSILFADLIEKQFAERAGRKSRGVKEAGFLVLFNTASPSVLVESGFLTNYSEEELLKSDYGQSLIASAIFRAFKSYKSEVEFESIKVENTVKDVINNGSSLNPNEPSKENIGSVLANNSEEQLIAVNTGSIPETKSSEPETKTIELETEPIIKAELYKIQIFASKDLDDFGKLELSKAVKNVSIEKATNGYNRYLIGNFDRYDEAKDNLEKLKTLGFDDAFLVRYKNGERQ